MKPIGRFLILLPVILAVVSFVLSMLALFAGHKQGFMEDYAVVRLNTSMVGHNLLDKVSDNKGGDKSDKKGGLLGDIKGWLDDKKGDAKDKINDVTGKIADKLAKKIGVREWYSLHIMDSCEGYFAPNATALNAGLNITNCTSSSPAHRLNLTDILDKELKVGPAKLNLADINWPDSIQDALDVLNDALLGLFIMYTLGVGFSGLSALGGVASFLKPDARMLNLVNMSIAVLGFLCVLIGSIIVTVATNKGVSKVNDVGEKAGLSASRGEKFYILSWIATGFMGIVTLFWLARFFMARRQRGRLNEKVVG
ncbi:SUR7 protein [Pochonia chlamydosporia 170]|uniref:SUR7 protein n=1 Tax=Pochonia chlamydosporia 170 TaxID=1380566 RepID=A0A179FC41_METCM|nr:SUR7 protein [Pochonia chlamydosporia 170]OAQ63135.1 SUR7 protein [Pochonia chlamydosporia 170]